MMSIKNFIFKTCAKTGKIKGIRTDNVYLKVLFPLMGVAALIWVAIRVIPKPSRASYPCQQAAIPVASTFVAWIVTSTAGVLFLRKAREMFKENRMLTSLIFVLGATLIFLGTNSINNTVVNAQIPDTLQLLSYGANQPVGVAKGIYPGRVTWIRDIKASPWDGKTGKWWEPGNINEEVLLSMYSGSLQALTNSSSDAIAWDSLFHYFNRTQKRGNRGWLPGELIAIKININNTYNVGDVDNDIDQSPQATRALLKQLTGPGGVAQKDIIVYDASVGWKVRAIPDRIYKPLHKEFPEVRWMDGQGIGGREAPEWTPDAIIFTSPNVELGDELPKAVVEASYLINVALFKGHEISGVTLGAKNHFGSIRYPQKDHGKYVSQMKGKPGDYNAYVDLLGCPNLGGKTMLYIVDGLYGMQTNVGDPQERDRWRRLFNGEWSASYFMSQDPIAIESVCLDFLLSEFQGELGYSGSKYFPKGSSLNCDNYLIQAAKGVNAEFGAYRPNGLEIGSLGVHEHWNNAEDKMYSRNLNLGNGIELYVIE